MAAIKKKPVVKPVKKKGVIATYRPKNATPAPILKPAPTKPLHPLTYLPKQQQQPERTHKAPGIVVKRKGEQ